MSKEWWQVVSLDWRGQLGVMQGGQVGKSFHIAASKRLAIKCPKEINVQNKFGVSVLDFRIKKFRHKAYT